MVKEKETESETEVDTEIETESETEKRQKPKLQSEAVITNNLEIYGYQISTAIGGMRTIYSVDETIEGQDVVEVGLIYGIENEGYNEADMVANSDNSSVHMEKGTVENGLLSEVFSKSQSYAMTMKFAAGTLEEFSHIFYVRAYAKLADGTYAYTPITKYTIYDIADHLYQNELMKNLAAHQYLYDNILSVVNPEYVEKEYGWSVVVKPFN